MKITSLISALLSLFYQVCAYGHDSGTIEWVTYKLLAALFLISMFITYETAGDNK